MLRTGGHFKKVAVRTVLTVLHLKCVFGLYLTLYGSKRFLYSMWLIFRELSKIALLTAFCVCFFLPKTNIFINNETFLLFFFCSHFLMLYSLVILIERETVHCLIQNFIKHKKVTILIIFEIFFWAPITADHYHFVFGCNAD